jgi:hypothetical protein
VLVEDQEVLDDLKLESGLHFENQTEDSLYDVWSESARGRGG